MVVDFVMVNDGFSMDTDGDLTVTVTVIVAVHDGGHRSRCGRFSFRTQLTHRPGHNRASVGWMYDGTFASIVQFCV